jgi:hypothetical protein
MTKNNYLIALTISAPLIGFSFVLVLNPRMIKGTSFFSSCVISFVISSKFFIIL